MCYTDEDLASPGFEPECSGGYCIPTCVGPCCQDYKAAEGDEDEGEEVVYVYEARVRTPRGEVRTTTVESTADVDHPADLEHLQRRLQRQGYTLLDLTRLTG
ncbi:hypothetical protein ACIQU4_15780 [Streptomyces sp. NPDC090741]|uniref:hypothetical protein n=1 Tax=Streptomyces sp. NPDC090741 TaxID=3365967 RepID=UPI003806E2B9